MPPLSRPSKSLLTAVATIRAKRNDTYQPVDMSFMDDLKGRLDANAAGRPFSTRPRTAFDDARDAERQQRGGGPCNLDDPTDPGAIMLRNMEELRKRMAEDPDTATLHEQMEQAKRDTIREIEKENRQRGRRERQRAKKARRKERQAAARLAAT